MHTHHCSWIEGSIKEVELEKNSEEYWERVRNSHWKLNLKCIQSGNKLYRYYGKPILSNIRELEQLQ